jgi:hypothetical protein
VATSFQFTNPALAGPLSSANIKVYDDGTDVTGSPSLSFVGFGGPGAYSLLVIGSTTNFSFSSIQGSSNQPGTSTLAMIGTSEFSVTARNSGGHTLKILFSDNGFSNPPSGPVVVTSSGSVTFSGLTSTSDTVTL